MSDLGTGGPCEVIDEVMELADGRRIQFRRKSREAKGSASVITLECAAGSAEPRAILFAMPTKEIPFVIPFEFKNVKLP